MTEVIRFCYALFCTKTKLKVVNTQAKRNKATYLYFLAICKLYILHSPILFIISIQCEPNAICLVYSNTSIDALNLIYPIII